MGKPAARLNDNHTCPAKEGKRPHVGGPIATGSPNVLIGGMPAARAGDMLVCSGPPDTISAGSASVFINGKPAARLGDKTAHGGVVVGGCGSVTIGDAGIVVPAAIASRQPTSKKNVVKKKEASESPLIEAKSESMANKMKIASDYDVAGMEICQKKQDGSCPKPNCECV